MAGCCGVYSKNRFFCHALFNFLIGILLIGTAFGSACALFLPEIGETWTYEEVIPLDNLPGGIVGLISVIGGSVGMSICCKSILSSESCTMRSFLAYSIIGIFLSLLCCLFNLNILTFFSDDVNELMDLGENKGIVKSLESDNFYFVILGSMHACSAGLNFFNCMIQFSAIIFICRGVKGYNDCTCCCNCCSPNEVHNEPKAEIEAEGELKSPYDDIEANGNDDDFTEDKDAVVTELKAEIEKANSISPEVQSHRSKSPTPVAPAVNETNLDDDIPEPDYL